MSILTEVLGIGQVWDGNDFVSVEVERLDAPTSKIWGNDLEQRTEGVEHQKNIRCFIPTHAIEAPHNILYLAEGEINGKSILFVAPEEGWGSRIVTSSEAFKGIIEEEFHMAHHWREFYRLQKLVKE